MFDGMAVAIQKPPLSSDTNNWKLKKVIIVTDEYREYSEEPASD